MNIRNIAIIAHVDHGKTTLVDALLRQGGVFRSNEEVDDRVMDSMDQERERGITIQAKNCSFLYKDTKVNIVDTPGHADFGGEVERILGMVDGACLLVDASEGPLPQTRFVLKKALEKNLKILVVINKIDRPDSRIKEVENEIFDLFIDLEANDEQMEYPTIYTIARQGVATNTVDESKTSHAGLQGNLNPLYEAILEIMPPPVVETDKPVSMLVSNLGHSGFLGKLAIGRIKQGVLRNNQQILVAGEKGNKVWRVLDLMTFEGLKQVKANEVMAGDIAVVAGIEVVHIGDTLTDPENPEIQERITVDPPAVNMEFMVNTSPYAGLDGKVLLSREFWERLVLETQRNVAIKIKPTEAPDTFMVFGRGELQLSVLVEQLRREGFELAVAKPKAVFKHEDGHVTEPVETAYVDVPEDYYGVVTELFTGRKGQLINVVNHGTGRIRLDFEIPSRGLIGFRTHFLTATRGTGILNTLYKGYEPYKGDFSERQNGAMVSDRKGDSVTYALAGLEPRGKLFIGPGVSVYEGMVVGEHSRDNDLWVNCIKEKKLTNVRASGSDDTIQLKPPVSMTFEKALEWIRDDEIIEVTPKIFRIRKRKLRKP